MMGSEKEVIKKSPFNAIALWLKRTQDALTSISTVGWNSNKSPRNNYKHAIKKAILSDGLHKIVLTFFY